MPINGKALESFAEHTESGQLREDQKTGLVNFAFPVSAKRSLDYADFFESHGSKELANLKEEQSKSF